MFDPIRHYALLGYSGDGEEEGESRVEALSLPFPPPLSIQTRGKFKPFSRKDSGAAFCACSCNRMNISRDARYLWLYRSQSDSSTMQLHHIWSICPTEFITMSINCALRFHMLIVPLISMLHTLFLNRDEQVVMFFITRDTPYPWFPCSYLPLLRFTRRLCDLKKKVTTSSWERKIKKKGYVWWTSCTQYCSTFRTYRKERSIGCREYGWNSHKENVLTYSTKRKVESPHLTSRNHHHMASLH